MNRVKLVLIAGMLVLPVGALAQVSSQQSKEPLLLQLFEDVSRSRQNMEVESAACKVQVKDLQQQLQAATEKKDTKETKEKK
jgi:hypothetical protein